MKYRSEIDGLRAFAIIPVLFFHAGFTLFEGGFVGVDIFFVISGYLITTIIINDLENDRFSLVNFYEKRVRRILPALFFLMIISFPLAWVLMLPTQMKEFSQSLFAINLFIANIHFWKSSGYFAEPSAEQPFLHAWSLAVEEQFYFVFPIFLIFMYRFRRDRVLLSIFVVAILSFILCEWGWRNKPNANFFLSPTRAWELLVGSIAAFIHYKNQKKTSNILSFIGLTALVISIFVYDEKTPFPSIYTLVPILGSVLIILYSDQKTHVGKLLSTKFFVGIGLLSYSLYLWHQPLFAFTRIYFFEPPSTKVMLLASLCSILIAFISWKFIETPFRNRSFTSQKHIFSFSLVGLLFFSALGWYGNVSNGFQSLMIETKSNTKEIIEYKQVLNAMDYQMYENMAVSGCKIWAVNTKEIQQSKIEKCSKTYGKALVVLGDSHAMNLFNILSFANTYPFLIGVSQGGCRPYEQSDNCHYANFDEFIKENTKSIDKIVYHQSGSQLMRDINGKTGSQITFIGYFDAFEDQSIKKIINYLNQLVEDHGVEVSWVGPFLEYGWRPKNVLFQERLRTVNPNAIKLFKELETQINKELNSSVLFEYFAYNTIFYEPKIAFEQDCFLFRDIDHYSRCGEKIIATKLKTQLLN